MKIEPTDEQKQLVKELCDWYRKRSSQYFSYSGPAGSGKTFIMEYLIEQLELDISEVACMAYVGKAVMLLLLKGFNAKTIHSTIYRPVEKIKVDSNGNPMTKENGKYIYEIDFILKTKLDDNIKMLFVDEASMVNDAMIKDILSFKLPTVFVGDHNQLPPVFGTSSVMLNPTFVLTKIMRQAENNPIIFLSQKVLNNEQLKLGTYGDSRIISDVKMKRNLIDDYDVILCGKNKTRDYVNEHIRNNILKFPDAKVQVNDKIICRKNNRNVEVGGFYLTTGMSGIVQDIHHDTYDGKNIAIDFIPDALDNIRFNDIDIDYNYIQKSYEERKRLGFTPYNKFEYGYCITTHLSQGSQYNRVLFFNERLFDADTTKKLQYTAITRAINSVDIVL